MQPTTRIQSDSQSTAACDESSSLAEVIRINKVQVKELRALRTMVEDQNTKIASLTTMHCMWKIWEGEIESHIVPKKSTERSKAVPGQSEDIVWFHGRSGVRVVTKVLDAFMETIDKRTRGECWVEGVLGSPSKSMIITGLQHRVRFENSAVACRPSEGYEDIQSETNDVDFTDKSSYTSSKDSVDEFLADCDETQDGEVLRLNDTKLSSSSNVSDMKEYACKVLYFLKAAEALYLLAASTTFSALACTYNRELKA
eukprot:Em0002g316a